MGRTRVLLIVGVFVSPYLFGFSLNSAAAEASSISIATDMTRYAQGDTIRLVVTNSLDKPIWYIGYPQPDLAFWAIEKATENRWHGLGFRLPVIENGKEFCRIAMYERPVGVVTALKPHSNIHFEWNQKICLLRIATDSPEPEVLEEGKYRLVLRYSLETVKSEDIANNPWMRPIELGEVTAVYSNEFFVD